MIVNRQAVNAYLDRELDQHAWIKKVRRKVLVEALCDLPRVPMFKTAPWTHQLACTLLGARHPRFLFLLEMGLGKSKIIADLISYRQRTRQLKRALVCVPRVINMSSWQDDLAKHSDLEPWLANVENIEEKWERLVNPRGDVTVIDYMGLGLALTLKEKVTKKRNKLVPDMDKVRQLQRLYNFIDLDECHKLGNPGSMWFTLLDALSESAEFVYGTTGTLFSKDPAVIWPQFKLVDRGETFGPTPSLFTSAFFAVDAGAFGNTYTFRRSMAADLNRMLQHRSIVYESEDVPDVDIPAKAPAVVMRLDMGVEQRQAYLKALEGVINAQEAGDEAAIEAPWIRMRQILSGYLAWNDSAGPHVVRFRENPKLDLLEGVLDDLGDKKLVVVHEYVETGKMISERLTAAGIKHVWLYGGTKDKAGTRTTFMRDRECRVFLMNTEAGGTGNDGLQSVCNYMYMFETPTHPTARKQVEKRLIRPGGGKKVFVYDPVFPRTPDTRILESLAEGSDFYDMVVKGHRLRRDILRA